MGKGDRKTAARKQRRAEEKRKLQIERTALRDEFALTPTRHREKGTGDYVRERSVKPTRAQIARRRKMPGFNGDPNDWIDVVVWQKRLTLAQGEALRRYRQLRKAYRHAASAPGSGRDALAALQPSNGSKAPDIDDETWSRLKREVDLFTKLFARLPAADIKTLETHLFEHDISVTDSSLERLRRVAFVLCRVYGIE